MRFAYLGTDRFAASVLASLVGTGRVPSLVVSRPDSRQGRGRRLAPPPVAVEARDLGLEVFQPESANEGDLLVRLQDVGIELLVLCAYGGIIREPLLSTWTILNLHPSLLPRWRGAAPIERALMAGDRSTGASVIRLVEELDAGPVALAEEVAIAPEDDFASLSARLGEIGVRLLLEALDQFEAGTLSFEPQAREGVTYAERIESADRLLDPHAPAIELERAVRALHPHIGARLRLPDGRILGVRGAVAIDDGPGCNEVSEDGGGLVVGCSQGALRLTRVVPPGGREMDASDWLRGGGMGSGPR